MISKINEYEGAGIIELPALFINASGDSIVLVTSRTSDEMTGTVVYANEDSLWALGYWSDAWNSCFFKPTNVKVTLSNG